MTNETILKFGYPETLIKAYANWTVVLRPKQATLGSLVLCENSDAAEFSKMSGESFAELPKVIQEIESSLSSLFSYDKINYLMLMMKDKNVHFHVVPRFSEDRKFEGTTFADPGWAGAPDLSYSTKMSDQVALKLLKTLRRQFEG